MTITAIIAAKNESESIAKSLRILLKSLEFTKEKYELIVVCADKETFCKVKNFAIQNKKIKVLKDRKKGKGAAINQALKIAKGRFILFTDGDVYLENKKYLNKAIKFFKRTKKIGLIAGRPIPVNLINNKYGYWSNFSAKVIHKVRKKKSKRKKFFPASGYLYITKRKITPKLPRNILADDHYISAYIYKRKQNLKYFPSLKVCYKAPENLKDFIKQKTRTFAGTFQSQLINKRIKKEDKRNLISEIKLVFEESKLLERKRIKIFWLIEFYVVRFFIWIIAYFKFYINNKNLLKLWTEVKTTKKI